MRLRAQDWGQTILFGVPLSQPHCLTGTNAWVDLSYPQLGTISLLWHRRSKTDFHSTFLILNYSSQYWYFTSYYDSQLLLSIIDYCLQIGNCGIVYQLATRLLQTSKTSARCQYSIISMAYVICSAIYRRRAVCTIQNTTIHRRLRLHAEINLLTVAMDTCKL